jgi:hypothetical protein
MAVPLVLPLLQRKQRLQRVFDIEATAGLQHLLSTLHGGCCHCPCKTRFRLAEWPLPGGTSTLWIALKGFRVYISFPFPGFILTRRCSKSVGCLPLLYTLSAEPLSTRGVAPFSSRFHVCQTARYHDQSRLDRPRRANRPHRCAEMGVAVRLIDKREAPATTSRAIDVPDAHARTLRAARSRRQNGPARQQRAVRRHLRWRQAYVPPRLRPCREPLPILASASAPAKWAMPF